MNINQTKDYIRRVDIIKLIISELAELETIYINKKDEPLDERYGINTPMDKILLGRANLGGCLKELVKNDQLQWFKSDYPDLWAKIPEQIKREIDVDSKPTAEAKAKAENLALRLDEKERLTKALSVLNKDQITVVQYLWEKYKGLEQFQGTAEMKKAGVTGYNGFAALFLSTKDKQHKDFYKNTFISRKDDSRMRKGYYKFSVHFQEQILETNHPI